MQNKNVINLEKEEEIWKNAKKEYIAASFKFWIVNYPLAKAHIFSIPLKHWEGFLRGF